MSGHMDILKMRILICFLEMKNCTVTTLAKTLGEEKYTISRAMIALGKEGFLDRSLPRNPRLTEAGILAAQKYRERMDIAINHLIYEGVGAEMAQRDARFLSLYCSYETFQIIQGMEERYRIKHVLRNRKKFDGSVLCRELRDGSYSLPFIIYKKHAKENNNISMANDGFEHPCRLIIRRGVGIIRLKAVSVTHPSAADGKKRCAKINSLKYADSDRFCDAERSGDFWQFPAEVLHFVNAGSETGGVFHGSVCLRMTNAMGKMHMPESTAIFTILF